MKFLTWNRRSTMRTSRTAKGPGPDRNWKQDAQRPVAAADVTSEVRLTVEEEADRQRTMTRADWRGVQRRDRQQQRRRRLRSSAPSDRTCRTRSCIIAHITNEVEHIWRAYDNWSGVPVRTIPTREASISNVRLENKFHKCLNSFSTSDETQLTKPKKLPRMTPNVSTGHSSIIAQFVRHRKQQHSLMAYNEPYRLSARRRSEKGHNKKTAT